MFPHRVENTHYATTVLKCAGKRTHGRPLNFVFETAKTNVNVRNKNKEQNNKTK